MSTSAIWRPPQWTQTAMVAVTVPNVGTLTSNGITAQSTTDLGPVTYVFDAVLGLEHDQRVTKTQHPVQTGSDVSSHAYIEPAHLVLYIGMSDAMDSYALLPTTPPLTPYQYPNYTPWTGASSKSVSAYLTMLNLLTARQPLTVTTRLRTYKNMLVTALSPREDSRTITGLRMRVELEQVFMASTQADATSARPNDTSSTGLGAVNVESPSTAVQSQFNVKKTTIPASTRSDNLLGWLRTHPSGVRCPGAGNWSSNNTSSLQQLPSPQ
jgi:hypothetical protein